MNKNKSVIGITLVAIMIASIFTVLPVAAQPPLPPEDDNPIINVNESGITASLRVYGENDYGPWEGYDSQGQMVYSDWWDPFDPTALQKDSLTFNPAIILDGGEYGHMSTGSEDIHVKKFLRLWYEPAHQYTKELYVHPTIEVETTYMLINAQDWIPTHGPADLTWFTFPIAEISGQTGLGAFENAEGNASRENMVELAYVSGDVSAYNKTTDGTIRLEKTYDLHAGETVQFLDHKLQYNYIVLRDDVEYMKVTMWYAGNIEDDTKVRLLLGRYDDGSPDNPSGVTWFKRHNERYIAPDHANHVTWYAQYGGRTSGYIATVTVGKELMASDTFYVNAVRYDVPAVEVLDTDGNASNGAEAFKYITLRTPLPKASTSMLVADDGKASSQWIDTIAPNETIPLNPPFNTNYTMVDDINVVLWEPNANTAEWPVGNTDPVTRVLGTDFWPWAERYLTMQEDEILKEVWCYDDKPVGSLWMSYFDVQKIDLPSVGDPTSPYWIAYDPSQRLCDATALKFCYIEESSEPEFRTDLYEILAEERRSGQEPLEYWDAWDIITLPDQYTEFALPARPDVPTPPWTKTGDYLLTTSFLAPNSINRSDINGTNQGIPRVSFAYDIENEKDALNRTLMGDALDLYVNPFGNATMVRVYGENDFGPIGGYGVNGTYTYEFYQHPFNPTAIRKDSITFNPAIVLDGEYNEMFAGAEDIDVKKYLRMWYEPDHVYSKPTYKYPTIEVETTYLLIDSQDKLPIGAPAGLSAFVFPIAEDTTTDQPGLELFENPGSNPDRENMVNLVYVNGTVEPYWKTVYDNATIRIEKTYLLNKGETVQFLDHNLSFVDVVVDNNFTYAKVKMWYAGNPTPDSEVTKELGQYDDGSPNDPHGLTWFDRHNSRFSTPSHPDPTWYAKFENYHPDYTWAEITVGMELLAGDVFYVDGVRYDVPAIEVFDSTNDTYADKFKYITLRTPLPKLDGVFITETDLNGHGCLADDGIISSQWIVPIPPETIIPLNPPFNTQHWIVDDIDVKDSSIENDVEARIIGTYDPLEVFWVEEAIEPRYSTNLLEILDENVTGEYPIVENWTKYDVITRPDQYTAFVLPGDIGRFNFTTNTWDEPLHNDYLLTTSFLAPNSNESSELRDLIWNIPRMAFRVDGIEKTGKYINEITEEPPAPWNQNPEVSVTIAPTGNVSGCEDVTVCTDGTTDDQWPLRVWVNWGDGTTSPEQVMTGAGDPKCFTHQYLKANTYTITVSARDVYGATGTNNSLQVTVESDCAVLTFRPGWNAFSTPVTSSSTVGTLFSGYGWFTNVWEYDGGFATVASTSTLDPKKGYFVYKDSMGTDTLEITGTAATFDDSWMTPGQWNLLGVGYDPVIGVEYYGYWWDPGTWQYLHTKDLQPGLGYFVKPPAP